MTVSSVSFLPEPDEAADEPAGRGGMTLSAVMPGPPNPPPSAPPQKKLPPWLSCASNEVILIVLKKRLSSFAVTVPVRVPARDGPALPVQPAGSVFFSGPVAVKVSDTSPCGPQLEAIVAVERSLAAV